MVRLRSKTCHLDERDSSEELIFSSEISSRRVWGKRPGQLALIFFMGGFNYENCYSW